MSALVEAMARAFVDSLKLRRGYVDDSDGIDSVTIEGCYDIEKAIADVLRAMADVEPSDGMCRAAVWSLEKAKEQAGKLQHDRPFKAQEKHAIRYRAMLRQAVAEAEKGRDDVL